MATLQRLIYRSTATGSTGSLLNMATILAESQRNNDRDGLTGALAAHDGMFLQVLEGAPSTLDQLLQRLERDPRHKDIVVIDRSTIEARLFGRWAMASARFSPALTPSLDALMADPTGSPERTQALLLAALEEG